MLSSKPKAQKLKEEAHKASRGLQQDKRGLDREITNLKREEAKITNQIKQAAKKPGQQAIVKSLAKELVRNRNAQAKLIQMGGKMTAVSSQIKTAAATGVAAQSMGNAAKTMGKMNKQMDLGKMQGMMQDFEKQNAQLEMKEGMMDDAMEMLDEDLSEGEQDDVMNSILDEIGLNVSSQMAAVPQGQRQQHAQRERANNDELALPDVPA